MDETAIAFELPHARARATHVGPPLDRISVRDYTRLVEIGAFRAERGLTQRIRFNVVLEVSHHTAARDDDVDKVISYDTITDAIEHEIAEERINLLETLAERVALRCLADPRAVRVFVRLEKLDRIPGALGVEIVRSRVARCRHPAACRRCRRLPRGPPPARASSISRPRSPPVADSARWRDALAAWEPPHVICLGPAIPVAPGDTEAQRRIGLLAIEQAAWGFCDGDPRFAVAASRTELDWALKTGRLTVWAPSHMVSAARHPAPDASDPVALAAWLAGELDAGLLVVAGAPLPAGGEPPAVAAADPTDLQSLG